MLERSNGIVAIFAGRGRGLIAIVIPLVVIDAVVNGDR